MDVSGGFEIPNIRSVSGLFCDSNRSHSIRICDMYRSLAATTFVSQWTGICDANSGHRRRMRANIYEKRPFASGCEASAPCFAWKPFSGALKETTPAEMHYQLIRYRIYIPTETIHGPTVAVYVSIQWCSDAKLFYAFAFRSFSPISIDRRQVRRQSADLHTVHMAIQQEYRYNWQLLFRRIINGGQREKYPLHAINWYSITKWLRNIEHYQFRCRKPRHIFNNFNFIQLVKRQSNDAIIGYRATGRRLICWMHFRLKCPLSASDAKQTTQYDACNVIAHNSLH